MNKQLYKFNLEQHQSSATNSSIPPAHYATPITSQSQYQFKIILGMRQNKIGYKPTVVSSEK